MDTGIFTYVIGQDEEGDHTFMHLDFDQQIVAIVQTNEDKDEPDVVAIPGVAVQMMARIVQMHTNASGELVKEQPNVH
jgi:hypothetical protein